MPGRTKGKTATAGARRTAAPVDDLSGDLFVDDALAAAVHDFLVYVGVLPYGSPELLNIATPVLLIALGAFAWVAGEAGFEHGTLLVTQYSSGVAGAALGLSVPIGDRLSWVATLRFRRGFLQAVTIPEAYETEVIDHPTILTLTAGIAYSL